MQTSTKHVTIALGVVATVILLATTSDAHAQIAICYSIDACDINHATGNPHSTAVLGDPNPGTTEKGNPHNSQSCSGNPHGEIGSDTCHGSQ
jgi:hypothetical protein